MPVNTIVGTDGANSLTGTAGQDLIYGFDPNGAQANVSGITTTLVGAGFNAPLYATAAPGDFNRLMVVEKGGLIRVLDLTTNTISSTPFANLSGEISTTGERGLLGFAFDPNYATNAFVYVYLTNNTTGASEVRRYSVVDGVVDTSTRHNVITIPQDAADNHKGGWISFGPDGYLYIATGDGGGAGDPNNNAQNPDLLLGKILRIDVRGDDFPGSVTANYAIPADNPFVGATGADEIYALGLRNPWRASFDLATGTFYIADVGQSNAEEINIGASGANYGWRRFEGNGDYDPGTAITIGNLTGPIHTYDQAGSQSITGGYVYRGASDALQGQYFFSDFSTGRIFTMRYDGANWVVTERTAQINENIGTLTNPSSFAQDAAGNLYAISINGQIFRLTPDSTSADVDDVLSGLAGDDFLYGGAGADVLQGGTDNDWLNGGVGADQLNGGTGADTLLGGDGYDTARYDGAAAGVIADLVSPSANTGEAQGDTFSSIEALVGSNFADTLRGDGGFNELHGFAGDDTLEGRAGGDLLNGGDGSDTASYASAPVGVSAYLASSGANTGVAAGDIYVSIENLLGSAFADVLGGSSGANIINGGGGNDIIQAGDGADSILGGDGDDQLLGGAGADQINGGAGIDIARYDDSGVGVTIDLQAFFASGGTAQGDVLVAVEGIVATGVRDLLFGDGAANQLYGFGGNDLLNGRDGNDYLSGGAGADELVGGAGADSFVFTRGDGGGDIIYDFDGAGAAAGDRIILFGYGTIAQGASFVQLDANTWVINSADGQVHDLISFANGAPIHASDIIFGP